MSLAVMLVIIGLGSIQLISTAHTYFSNLSQLNSLKAQEAALQTRDSDLKNNIARWSDKAYVITQARENLGFVFPGETSIMIVNSQAVEGSDFAAAAAEAANTAQSASSSLPWYSELAYSLGQADKGLATGVAK
jgi:cell division protein FtsB